MDRAGGQGRVLSSGVDLKGSAASVPESLPSNGSSAQRPAMAHNTETSELETASHPTSSEPAPAAEDAAEAGAGVITSPCTTSSKAELADVGTTVASAQEAAQATPRGRQLMTVPEPWHPFPGLGPGAPAKRSQHRWQW